MTGVEIDMVVLDSLKALELYESIFELQRIEVTNFPKGQNEAVFTIYGSRFHLLDENAEYQLIAPNPESPKSIWFNILVTDIKSVHSKAIKAGCTQIQPVTEITDYGVSNSMFSDSFGYVWMIQQIHTDVSFEERNRMWEEKISSEK